MFVDIMVCFVGTAAGVDSNLHEEADLVVERGKPVNDHNTPDLTFLDIVVPGVPEFDRKLGAPAKRFSPPSAGDFSTFSHIPFNTVMKKVYMSILRRELPKLLALSSGTFSHQSLENIVIQLRKAGSHPHLFAGIEPEPYEDGEHLVQASGKLVVLDQLLQKLHTFGHRVLLFAQMTHTLDVLQDYMELRKYPYDRLDGSIRAEEWFVAIWSFSRKSGIGNSNSEADSDSAFVFMISSRAGGDGLNLVAADTVTRERALRNWVFDETAGNIYREFGSGYPGVFFVYHETDQPSKLQIRDEGTKWSFPVQIEKEDTIFLVLKEEDGTPEI
ncbi:unnamed protein product [Lactuca saligna]|uniref:Helicase C-terminal domain-containing protein n=1 Tax=Lactuca saligna TaxID=75948 RepID=A0AA35YEL7_LACSI|nr:unnamed protein product [Lactuca saligna]